MFYWSVSTGLGHPDRCVGERQTLVTNTGNKSKKPWTMKTTKSESQPCHRNKSPLQVTPLSLLVVHVGTRCELWDVKLPNMDFILMDVCPNVAHFSKGHTLLYVYFTLYGTRIYTMNIILCWRRMETSDLDKKLIKETV